MKDHIDTVSDLQEELPNGELSRRVGLACMYSECCVYPHATAIRRRCRIGRLPDRDIILDEDRVSREHAIVELGEQGVWVTDLKSRNGTFINGNRLGADRFFAPFGSVLRIGSTLMLVADDVDAFINTPVSTELPLVGGARTTLLRRKLEELALGNISVLLEGETGTGKEQAARLIHTHSGRFGEFVGVNCATLPADLVESELFGHVRGAFSGSQTTRNGLFRAAHRGTLLLDEIGDLPLAAQAKLLRVLEEHSVRPLGQDESIPVDVRIIAATNRPLESMIEAGRFRDDLYHRIAAAHIELPPLRDRIEDIPLLVRYFLRDSNLAISITALERCLLAPWPGNVRQLRNMIATISGDVRRGGREAIRTMDLGPVILDAPAESEPGAEVNEIEKARLCTALKLKRGNVAQVARELGMRRTALYAIFHRLGIDPSQFRSG
jgi:DNA-binding NtrC family response regulator